MLLRLALAPSAIFRQCESLVAEREQNCRTMQCRPRSQRRTNLLPRITIPISTNTAVLTFTHRSPTSLCWRYLVPLAYDFLVGSTSSGGCVLAI
ncbi:hypothetical protein HD554DRAFT_2145945 [Boletus coccyginus]|nr:hypothetical protein HD554DRAFT_2145945 [Boletus coccyginus]